jgi:hypothetical protein
MSGSASPRTPKTAFRRAVPKWADVENDYHREILRSPLFAALPVDLPKKSTPSPNTLQKLRLPSVRKRPLFHDLLAHVSNPAVIKRAKMDSLVSYFMMIRFSFEIV